MSRATQDSHTTRHKQEVGAESQQTEVSFQQEGPAQAGEPEVSPAPGSLALADVNRQHVITPSAWLSSPLTQHWDADAGPAPLPMLHQISIHLSSAPKTEQTSLWTINSTVTSTAKYYDSI